MGDDFIKNLAIEQRRRLVGSILEYAEQRVYPHIPVAEQRAFRQKVLTAVGAYHDMTLDMLKASVSDGTVVNERALELLEQIHAATRAPAVRVPTGGS
jgi:hypothetical protein